MAWIEVHQALLTHRKTISVAWDLGVDPACVVGHMVCLWLWALDNAPSGDISQLDQRMVAQVGAGYSGDASAFMSAIETAGFISRDNDGKLVIHDWHMYAGRYLDKKAKLGALEATRAAEKAIPRAGAPVDVHAGAPADVRADTSPVPDRTLPGTTPRTHARGAATASREKDDDEPSRLPNGAQQCPICPEVFTGLYADHLATSPRHKVRDEPEDFSGKRKGKQAPPSEVEVAAELQVVAARPPLTVEELSATMRAEHEQRLALDRERRAKKNGRGKAPPEADQ